MRLNQTITAFVQSVSNQGCFFSWSWNKHQVESIHHTLQGRMTIESRGWGVERGMIDGIALTNTGTGRRFTVAVLSTLTILLPPLHCFNPSHTQMSQRCTHTHTRSTYNAHVHHRVRLGYGTLTFARQEGVVNDKGGRHEWLRNSLLWLPLRHPLDWRRIDGDICLPELSFFFIEVQITGTLRGGSSRGWAFCALLCTASQPV